MRITSALGLGLGVAAALGLAGPAGAQVKGAGKATISLIATPGVDPAPATVGAKAAGSIGIKPVASVAGKAPTGGSSFALKLAKDVGDPLKPGFAPGNYVLEVETGATSEADAVAAITGTSTFATITIDAAGKCTINANEEVDGDGSGDLCGAAPFLCAPSAAGKCSATAYQLAGVTNTPLGPGDGQPLGARFRLRTLVNGADCNTGGVHVNGVALPPPLAPGSTTCKDPANVVVGVFGVANGDIIP